MDAVNVMLVGGPTLVIEVAGYRMITDPTFDPPQVYHHPLAGPVTKNLGPSHTPEELGQIDLALASHEHIDNLDVSGRGFLTMVPLALITADAAKNFGPNVEGMSDYDVRVVKLPDGREMKVTAVPAQHGPDEVAPALAPVIGFVLEAQDMPTVYISGDNSEVDVVREIASRFPKIDIAVLFVGGARFDAIAGGQYITLSNERALECAQILGAKRVVPVHEDSWAHFSQNAESISAVFAETGMSDHLVALKPGESETITL